MELNRNNLLMWGVLLLFFGLQFHYFDSYILTEKASKVYFDRFEKKSKAPEIKQSFLEDAPQVMERKTIKPPHLARKMFDVRWSRFDFPKLHR